MKNQKINTDNYYWCVVSKDGRPDIHTISYYRRDAIRKHTKDCNIQWVELRKKYGYKCVKIKITEHEK